MSQNDSEQNFLSSENIFLFILKWWKPLLIVVLVSAVASTVISGFIKPKFKSSVIFFPGTSASISKALLSDLPGDKQDLLEFGEEVQAEQMLQILHSDDIRDMVIEKYDLMKHYDIDSESDYPKTKLYKQYEDNISFERTEFMSVKISVLDHDAQMAADIANDIASYLDSMKTRIQRQRAEEGFKIVAREYSEQSVQLQILEDSLTKIRSKGIFDYEIQSKILNEEHSKFLAIYNQEKARIGVLASKYDQNDTIVVNAKARISGAEAALKNIESRLELLAKLGGSSLSLSEQIEIGRRQLGFLKEKYEKARIDAQQEIPHKFIVNHAVKAEKKSYPVRWIIVLVSIVSSVLLSIILIISFEYFKKFRTYIN